MRRHGQRASWRDIRTGETLEAPPEPMRAYTTSELERRFELCGGYHDALTVAAEGWLDAHMAEFGHERLRCDLCGGAATTVHWVPWVDDGSVEACLVACEHHDAGGYWMPLADLLDGPGDVRGRRHGKTYTSLNHLLDTKGTRAVYLYLDRLDEARWKADQREA